MPDTGADLSQAPSLQGTLHIYVAFDWGDEILLDRVRQLAPASAQALPRRRRTPASFSYRPAPLFVPIPNVEIELAELGLVQATARVTLFDFGAVSLSLQVAFDSTADSLLRLAGSLADAMPLIQKA